MCIHQAFCHAPDNRNRFCFVNREFHFVKRVRDVFHLDIWAGEDVGRIDLNDIFVVEAFPDIEFFGELRSRLLVEPYRDFHRNVTVVLFIVCLEHPGDPALCDIFRIRVFLFKGRRQPGTVLVLGHGRHCTGNRVPFYHGRVTFPGIREIFRKGGFLPPARTLEEDAAGNRDNNGHGNEPPVLCKKTSDGVGGLQAFRQVSLALLGPGKGFAGTAGA